MAIIVDGGDQDDDDDGGDDYNGVDEGGDNEDDNRTTTIHCKNNIFRNTLIQCFLEKKQGFTQYIESILLNSASTFTLYDR